MTTELTGASFRPLTYTPEDFERAKQICLEKGYCSTQHLMLGLTIAYSRSVAIRKALVEAGFLTSDFRTRGYVRRKKNDARTVRGKVQAPSAANHAA